MLLRSQFTPFAPAFLWVRSIEKPKTAQYHRSVRVVGGIGRVPNHHPHDSEVKTINELRIHEVGNIKFVNLNVSLDEDLYLIQVEKIKERLRNRIMEEIPGCKIILETKIRRKIPWINQ